MPEICEIIVTTHFISYVLKNKFVIDIIVLSGRYLKNKINTELINKHKPLKLINIDSKGKFLWFEFQNIKTNYKVYILNTFGLTGGWGITKDSFNRVELSYINNNNEISKLYYNDQLNFGTLKITNDYNYILKKINQLGPDLIKDDFDFNVFKNRINNIKNKKIPIVKLLLTQDKKGIGSGIGNYLSAEILYMAKINPARHVDTLQNNELKNLFNSIKYELKLCYYNNDIGYMEKFGNFNTIHNKGIRNGVFPNYLQNVHVGNNKFKFNVYRQKIDPLGNIVEKAKLINGRSTYWVPSVQI